MSVNLNVVKGSLRAVGNRVLVTDMYFGEQKTASGLIINNDDGKTRGIYPRWGKVYAKGPDNKDEYKIGDWILIEHGRWTRGIKLADNQNELVVRMVETESVLAFQEEKPNDVYIGAEYTDGQGVNIRPDDFINSKGIL
jgi:co-chaperonin GroES (HSP10)